MSIVARPPVADPPRGSRAGDEPSVDNSRTLSEVLLTSDGTPAPAPAPTPRRALALDSLQILRQARRATNPAWEDPAFIRAVEAVRADLAPIRSRDALAASFSREAFHVRRSILEPDGAPAGPVGPVRLAYAVRWLELGDGTTPSPWRPNANVYGRGRGTPGLQQRRLPGGPRPGR